jgi:hypothetical protein
VATPNFSGVWKLDLEKSQLRSSIPQRITVRIEHDASTVRQAGAIMGVRELKRNAIRYRWLAAGERLSLGSTHTCVHLRST